MLLLVRISLFFPIIYTASVTLNMLHVYVVLSLWPVSIPLAFMQPFSVQFSSTVSPLYSSHNHRFSCLDILYRDTPQTISHTDFFKGLYHYNGLTHNCKPLSSLNHSHMFANLG